MTYLFSNPQIKKWKTLFLLSFVFNIVLIGALFLREKEVVNETKQQNENIEKTEVSETLNSKLQNDDEEFEKKEAVKNKKIPEGESIISSVTIEDNFFAAFNLNEEVKKLAEETGISNLSDLLSAHIGRLLVWDLVLRSDVRTGDKIYYMFRIIPLGEKKIRNDMPDSIEILFVEYHSRKFNKKIKIFRFQKADSKFSKYYYADGAGIEKLITPNPPIKDFVQITSLVGDRAPKHEGMDFKALVGTPVYATVDGTVLRKNWMRKYNGYCVEIKEKNRPFTFKYLHLDSVDVDEGQSVKKGDKIAASGNTGKTTAPHLHYQINVGQKGAVVDPMKHHKTFSERLTGDDLEKFKSFVVEMESVVK